MDEIINKELLLDSNNVLINECDITGIIILTYLLALFLSYFAIVVYLNIPPRSRNPVSRQHKITNKKSQLSNPTSRGRIKKITQRRTRKRLNKKE